MTSKPAPIRRVPCRRRRFYAPINKSLGTKATGGGEGGAPPCAFIFRVFGKLLFSRHAVYYHPFQKRPEAPRSCRERFSFWRLIRRQESPSRATCTGSNDIDEFATRPGRVSSSRAAENGILRHRGCICDSPLKTRVKRQN